MYHSQIMSEEISIFVLFSIAYIFIYNIYLFVVPSPRSLLLLRDLFKKEGL